MSASANFWLALVKEREEKWDEAIALLKKVSAKTPETGVLLRLAFCYSQIGKDNEAIETLKTLSKAEPENTDFLNYLVLAYEKTGDFGWYSDHGTRWNFKSSRRHHRRRRSV
jgi:predicted Zn-dependent protease